MVLQEKLIQLMESFYNFIITIKCVTNDRNNKIGNKCSADVNKNKIKTHRISASDDFSIQSKKNCRRERSKIIQVALADGGRPRSPRFQFLRFWVTFAPGFRDRKYQGREQGKARLPSQTRYRRVLITAAFFTGTAFPFRSWHRAQSYRNRAVRMRANLPRARVAADCLSVFLISGEARLKRGRGGGKSGCAWREEGGSTFVEEQARARRGVGNSSLQGSREFWDSRIFFDI